MTCRIVKDLSLENVFFIFKDESLYQTGWQFSCHLITGRNVKNLSRENVDLILCVSSAATL